MNPTSKEQKMLCYLPEPLHTFPENTVLRLTAPKTLQPLSAVPSMPEPSHTFPADGFHSIRRILNPDRIVAEYAGKACDGDNNLRSVHDNASI